MKKIYSHFFLFTFAIGAANALSAQCPAITCPGNVTINNDPGNCGAVYTFTPPVGINTCGSTTLTFNYTGAIQTWTVPVGITSLHIEARGAEGGHNNNSVTTAGLGASMSGDFTVTPGQQIKILVGQQPTSTAGNGGGGGTFVTDISNTPLIVAGGGGGSSSTTDSPLKHGQITTSGGAGAAGGGAGGTNGSGGSIGSSGFQSGAGGGLLTNGSDGWTTGTGGFAFVNGGSGGTTNAPANGGFGGGGSGSSYVVGGGGGGYSGGGSGGNSTAGVGGGGGSYNAGTNQLNAIGANIGHGLVTISYAGGAVVTTTLTAGLPSGSFFPIGTTTETYTASDTLGNSVTCSFDIVVVDNENPVITAPANISVSADSGLCTATVNYTAPVGTDNCSGATTVLISGLGSGGTFPLGTTTETYEVTDAAGHTANCSFTITVTDDEAPVFTCGGNVLSCVPVVNGLAPGTVTDNCSGVATIDYTLSGATTGTGSNDASGTTFNAGITTVQYTVTDANGNSSTCSFDVNYDPAPAIVLSAFDPDTICINAQQAALPAATPVNGVYSGIGINGNFFDPSISGVGSFWIAYTYTNASGCSSIDSTEITVDICMGIETTGTAEQIQVYPNPTGGTLFIDLGKSADQVFVRISEMNGQLVRQNEYNGTNRISTDISDLAAGIYLLNIQMDGQVKTIKLIRN